MKKSALLVSILGVAGAAQANTWILDAPAEVGPGETFTVSLTLDYDPDVVAPDEDGNQGLSASIFDVAGSSPDGNSFSVDSWSIAEDLIFLTGDLTTSDGTGLQGVNIGQLTLFGPFTADDPLAVLTFEVTAGPEVNTNIDFSTVTEAFQLWIGVFDDNPTSTPFDPTEGNSNTFVTPTPASAALLGLGGLVALRRRR